MKRWIPLLLIVAAVVAAAWLALGGSGPGERLDAASRADLDRALARGEGEGVAR